MEYFLTAAYTDKDSQKTDIFSKKVMGDTLKEIMTKACEGAPGVFNWWTIVEVETGEIVAKRSEHAGKICQKKGAFEIQRYN